MIDFRVIDILRKIRQLDLKKIEQVHHSINDDNIRPFLDDIFPRFLPLIQEGKAIEDDKIMLRSRENILKDNLAGIIKDVEDWGMWEQFRQALHLDFLVWRCKIPKKAFLFAVNQHFIKYRALTKLQLNEYVYLYKISNLEDIMQDLLDRKILEMYEREYCPECDGVVERGICMMCMRVVDEPMKEKMYYKGTCFSNIIKF